MGKQTIAECVEEEAVLACLRGIGIDFVQGYAIGRPQPLGSPSSVPDHLAISK
jgi:EAL domain-containing protein (putative c-di-GMP-specific phosphodiesterase class I)